MFFKTTILSLLLLTGCVSQTVHWGAWSEWGEWKDTGNSESCAVTVTSEPLKAGVYVDEKFEGFTPLTVSLSYPVLESEMKRHKYETTRYNATPAWLLFREGDKPGSSKVVDSERKTRNMIKNVTHNVVVRREGYRDASKLVTREDSSAHLVLKQKPCLFFNNTSVENESQLTVVQKMYDALFQKKYAKDVKPEDLQNVLQSDKHLKSLFTFTGKREGCNRLDSKLTIRDDHTDISITISDGKGNDVARGSSKFTTPFERAQFLSDLRDQVDKEAYKIYMSLTRE